jgi:hypothetical protein
MTKSTLTLISINPSSKKSTKSKNSKTNFSNHPYNKNKNMRPRNKYKDTKEIARGPIPTKIKEKNLFHLKADKGPEKKIRSTNKKRKRKIKNIKRTKIEVTHQILVLNQGKNTKIETETNKKTDLTSEKMTIKEKITQKFNILH